ncbi:hypothetical protein C5X46_012200, partial [Klebsiella pneumoniae subsp. pneumoniae]
ILRGVRQQQDEPGRFSICSRQAAVVLMHRGAEKLRYRGTTIHKRRRADPLKPEIGSARRETGK